MTRTATGYFGLLLLWATITVCHLPLHPDEAYYWHWSRHLELSYFDGPPLIAYLIKLFVSLFGVHTWSIKLVSASSFYSALTSYII